MPKVKINDISIYYEVYGAGEPLLLIAGLGSDSSSWSGVVGEFAKNYQVIIFDNRNCGRSDTAEKECTISLMAQDIIGLLDYLKIKKTHVLGHSMGGYIAQDMAVSYPGRIDKLVLESTAAVSSQRNNLLFNDFYKQLKNEGHTPNWFKKWADWLFSAQFLKDSAFLERFIEESIKYPYLQSALGLKMQIEAIAAFDLQSKTGAIKADTLVIAGRNDLLITPYESKSLADNINKSTFKLLDGVAHCIHIENPKLFTDTVLDFLNN